MPASRIRFSAGFVSGNGRHDGRLLTRNVARSYARRHPRACATRPAVSVSTILIRPVVALDDRLDLAVQPDHVVARNRDAILAPRRARTHR
jgi:hypothetical protein